MRKFIGRLIIWVIERFNLRNELNKWEKKNYDELKARAEK